MSLHFSAADAFHDSRRTDCRLPCGAVPANTIVRLRLYLSERFADADCLLCTQDPFGEGVVLMERLRVAGKACREASIRLEEIGLAHYWFVVNDGRTLLYYGKSGALTQDLPQPFQITVYDPAFVTPQWFRHCVAYHIFVDRFHRSDGLGGLSRAEHHERLGRTVVKHYDWNELVLFEPLPGKTSYDPCDFYGGDLQGIAKKLPYLAELGVGVLYLSPIFESPSNHKYNTSDYATVDPMYGTEEDFRALCEKAASFGIRVMLDGVFSHTGDDSLYFNKYNRYDSVGAANSVESPYYGWYQFDRYPDSYTSWWGFPSLPEVNELNPSYSAFIATDEDAILKKWIRAGAMGWRLDVADELPDEFIALLRTELKKEQPDAVLLGEVWEDASNKFSMGKTREYVLGCELDSVMNYPFRKAVLDFFRGRIPSESLVNALETLREHYPPPFFYSCLNLLSSHDVPRALTLLGNGPDKDSGLSRKEQAEFALSPEARQKALRLMALATAVQMTLPGVPCIYYGDEAGLEGCMDPFNRAPFPWGREDETLQTTVREWANLRNRHAALRAGRMALSAPHRDVFFALRFVCNGQDALGEEAEDGVFFLLVNRNEHPAAMAMDASGLLQGGDFELLGSADGTYRPVASIGASFAPVTVTKNFARLTLPPLSAALYRKED
ncbi:MAG: glycoside hydrolase family 13 protein [Christensenellales bacterium]|jgi:cyclomaltodextrinase